MNATRNEDDARRRSRPTWRSFAAALAFGAALVACGSSPPNAAITETIVKPPTDIVQSCTYAPDDKVPAGEPQGEKPPFRSFSPEPAAETALRHIKDHGGTGLVYGYQLPSGTDLYAGPDPSSAPVATISIGRSVFLFDPVIWTTSAGQHWLVTFVACGGNNPYWISVDQVKDADVNTYEVLVRNIASLLATQDYPSTGQSSSLPVIVDISGRFAWKDTAVPFSPGRAEYLGYGD